MITIQNLVRLDKESGQSLIGPCSAQIQSGDRIILSGSSGSGKSVFMRTLALLDAPDQGQILYQGHVVQGALVYQYRHAVSYVRQSPSLVGDVVLDHFKKPFTFKQYKNQSFPDTKVLNYLAYFDRKANFLQQDIDALSGGEQQIVNVITAILLQPKVLLLDEPSAALDERSALQLERLLTDYVNEDPQRAFVMITHDAQQAQRLGKQFWSVDQHQLIQGGAYGG